MTNTTVTASALDTSTDLTAAGEAFDLLRQATELGEAQAAPGELNDCLAKADTAAQMAWAGGSQEAYSFAVFTASIRRRAAAWRLASDVTEPVVVLLIDEVDLFTGPLRASVAAALER